jgi:hypothetical protein
MSTVTITAGATAATGKSLSTSLAVPVTSMLIGSDRAPMSGLTAAYTGVRYTRLYGAPGKGIPSVAAVPAGCVAHVSFKDSPTATLVNPWLDTITHPVILEWHHEPEGDMTAAAYRAGVAALIALVRAHPNGHWVKVAQTLTRFAQAHPGKLMTDGTPATVANLWCGADLIGMDCEKDSSFGTGCPDPKSFFAVAVAAAKQVGRPFVIPELGWVDPGDGTLAGWYTACVAYLRSVGCFAVAVYDTLGSTGDYRLSNPALAAWQHAVASQ